MIKYVAAVVMLTTGCIHSVKKPHISQTETIRSAEFQQEIDQLLSLDRENKKWEHIYLHEISTARENDDQPAYKFYTIEYLKLPRLILPEWMKAEPGYVEGPSAEQVLQAEIRVIIKLND